MNKILRTLLDILGLLAAGAFLAWAYFYDTGSWETLIGYIQGVNLQGTMLDYITIASVVLGSICTLILLFKGRALFRGPVKINLIR